MAGMVAESVAVVVADPPYGIGYHSNHYKDKNPHAPIANDWNFQPGQFFQECHRLLCDGGAAYVFCRWDVSPLWLPYLKGCGLKVKTIIAWVKDNWSAGDLEGCFGNQYEQVIFATKGRHKLRGHRWSNVWEFPRVPHTKMLHPSQKPVPLLERAIRSSSDPGDLILDPYMGSGSTGEACMVANRNACLIDIDPRMVQVAGKRLGIAVDIGASSSHPEGSSPAYGFEVPDPHEWGVHPEDLQSILAMIRGNLRVSKETENPLFSGISD